MSTDFHRNNITMNSKVGTCSICLGPVTIPTIWHGTVPPTPHCEKCGATAAAWHGPVIPMTPPAQGTYRVPREWVSGFATRHVPQTQSDNVDQERIAELERLRICLCAAASMM